MRIVLDTNVVLSALLWRGTPYRLLEAIQRRSSTQLYSSTALLEELTDVLTRPSAIKRLALICYRSVVMPASPSSMRQRRCGSSPSRSRNPNRGHA